MKLIKHNPLKTISPILLILLLILVIVSNSRIVTTSNEDASYLDNKIVELEERINSLTLQLQSIKESDSLGPFKNPDFDSDWIPIEPGDSYTFYHGQGANPLVYILGWDDEGVNGYSIHQSCNGVDFWDTGNKTSCGLMWCCPNVDEICVLRDVNDAVWDEFRLLIWKLE